MNPGVSGNVKFFYYLIEGMVGVCFYGEVFRSSIRRMRQCILGQNEQEQRKGVQESVCM